MSALSLEQRVEALEAEVAKLKTSLGQEPRTTNRESGWEKIYGSFANDPMYEEAMRLGREYRESLRPKANRSTRKSTQSKRTRARVRRKS